MAHHPRHPLLPGISGLQPQSQPLFRSGEAVRWLDLELEPGVPFSSKCWDPSQNPAWCSSFELYAVTWDVFAQDPNDLPDLLWYGVLSWEFVQLRVEIGPLSLFDGSFSDLLHRNDGRTDLEKMAQAAEEVEWMEKARTFLLGRGQLYRGMKVYRQHSVLLPAGETYGIRLALWKQEGQNGMFSSTPPLVPRGRVRIRVNFAGTYRVAL